MGSASAPPNIIDEIVREGIPLTTPSFYFSQCGASST